MIRTQRHPAAGLRSAGLALALSMIGAAGAAQAADTAWSPTHTLASLPAGASATDLPADTTLDVVLGLQPGLTAVQAQPVLDYLQQQGFTAVTLTPSRMLVAATGTAAQIEAAFDTRLESFSYQGRTAYANADPAQVPQALGGLVQAVLGLQDAAQPRVPIEATPEPVPPPIQPPGHNHAPEDVKQKLFLSDIAHLYDADPLGNATRAIVDVIATGDLAQVQSDLKFYLASTSGIAQAGVAVSRTDGGSYQDDPAGDLAWTAAGQTLLAMAGGTHQLDLYDASAPSEGKLLLALDKALTDAGATNDSPGRSTQPMVTAILFPYVEDEGSAYRSGFMQSFDAIAGTAGEPYELGSPPLIVVPAGDNGPYAQSAGVIVDGQGQWLVDPAAYSVNFPASSPYVDAVGGTALYSGGDHYYGGTFYDWESAWNSGLAPLGDGSGDQQLLAGGGGESRYEPAKYPVPGHSNRVVPDFAFDANPDSGVFIWQESIKARSSYGGTLLAAAIYTGITARMYGSGESTSNVDMNSLAILLSRTRDSALREQVLRPVNYGSNGYGGYGYPAVTGYDAASGWGSVDALQAAWLVQNKMD